MLKPVIHNYPYGNRSTDNKEKNDPKDNLDGYCCLSCFNGYHEELLPAKFECSCACHGRAIHQGIM